MRGEGLARIVGLVAAAIGPCASTVWAQQTLGDRAPLHPGASVERGVLSLAASNAWWDKVAVKATAGDPQVLPPAVPGEPAQIGVNAQPPGGAIGAGNAGAVTLEGGQIVWRVRLDAPGAGALRLRLTSLDLPAGASALVAGDGGTGGIGGRGYVLRGRGSLQSGSEWTPVLDGSRAYVEYRGPAASGKPVFTIDEVAEIAAPWPHITGPIDALPCEVDVKCQPVDPVARDAVCLMIFSNGGGTFACSGTLLNDTDPATMKGWLLTARHCINNTAAAASLTAYWFYHTPSCDGEPPALNTLPVSNGATLLVASAATDMSFLQLAQDPVDGQGLAGWTAEEPAGTLWSIHHPGVTFKRVASGLSNALPPICFGSLGVYQYLYLDWSVGITEDSSGGAPLFNPQWQVVGQYFGSCSTAPPACDNPTQWSAVFGRFGRSLPLIASYLAGQSSPSRIYVNAAATGANTGLSWEDAATDLAAVVRDVVPPAGGTEIWVAAGTYKPAAAGASLESAFRLVRGARLYGGFVGTETGLTQRDIVANATILSGDLLGDDAPNFANRVDNVYHVVRGTGVDDSAVLDGFTIQGGNAAGGNTFNDKGGGIYIEGGAPRIRSCTFRDNKAVYSGGAMALFSGGIADLQDCTFTANTAQYGGAISMTGAAGSLATCTLIGNSTNGDGGAIDLYDSSPSFVSCLIKGNTTTGRGGGAIIGPSGQPVFSDCSFELNNAGFGGGGVSASFSNVTFTQCDFLKNTGANFGGAFVQTNGTITTSNRCRFLGNSCGLEGGAVNVNTGAAAFTNCEFSGNRSTGSAAGAIWQTHDCQLSLLACTIAGNTAQTSGGGIVFDSGAASSMINTIAWGNTDASGQGQVAQVRVISGAPAVSYSLIQGLDGSLGGAGNIGGNPQFASPLGPDAVAGTEDDDLSLGATSPAIDAGDSGAMSAISLDLRGHARREDDPCTPNTGTGPAPAVDMGAIERAACSNACYANCDLSAVAPILNVNDFQCFLNMYAIGDPYANCDGSTTPPALNVNDFQCFVNMYAIGCT